MSEQQFLFVDDGGRKRRVLWADVEELQLGESDDFRGILVVMKPPKNCARTAWAMSPWSKDEFRIRQIIEAIEDAFAAGATEVDATVCAATNGADGSPNALPRVTMPEGK